MISYNNVIKTREVKKMTDYLIEIMKARKKYYRKRNEFADILDKWEDEHENMGNFTVQLNWRDKTNKELKLEFRGEVNEEVISLLCDEFNVQVIDKYTHENIYHKTIPVHTTFLLRHKEYPFGL